MSDLITVKIDITKVDMAKLFHGKNGAQHLDIVLNPSRESKDGDTHFIVLGVTKQEREAGIRGAIVGNAKGKWTALATPPPAAGVQEDLPNCPSGRDTVVDPAQLLGH